MYEIFIDYNPAWRGYDIYVGKDNKDGTRSIVKPLVIEEEVMDASKSYEPTFRITHYDRGEQILTELGKALIKAGFMPDYKKEQAGELGAVKNHLQDMRRLVFKEEKET